MSGSLPPNDGFPLTLAASTVNPILAHLATLDGEVTTLNGEIATINGHLGTLDSEVSALQSDRPTFGTSFPTPQYVGQIFWLLVAGAFLRPFIWTGGNWISPTYMHPLLEYDGTVRVTQTDVTSPIPLGPPAVQPSIDVAGEMAAGCTLFLAIDAVVQGSAGKSAFAGFGIQGFPDSGTLISFGNATTVEVSDGSGNAVGVRGSYAGVYTGFLNATQITPYVYGYRSSGGVGISANYYGAWLRCFFVR